MDTIIWNSIQIYIINKYILFTLRKITKTGVEMNFDLGNHYTLITKERSPEEGVKIILSMMIHTPL